MNILINPAFWGSFISLLIGLFFLTISTLISGIPLSLPYDIGDASFYSLIFITFIFSLRYYMLIYLNAYKNSSFLFEKLPSQLKITLFFLFALLTCLCLLSVGAIIRFGINATLIILVLMSFSSLFVGLICWVLYKVDKWPKVAIIFIGAELFFLIIAFLTREMILHGGHGIGNILPIFSFILFIIFAHEFMKYYSKAIKSQLSDLKNMLFK